MLLIITTSANISYNSEHESEKRSTPIKQNAPEKAAGLIPILQSKAFESAIKKRPLAINDGVSPAGSRI
jgi:predicted nucleic acid binding AN1-type Zn finger protein